MSALLNKISLLWKRAKQALSFFSIFKKTELEQSEIDKKLVYALSPRKIPTSGQVRHLSKFLNPRENLIVKICLLLIIVNVVYLGIVFIKKHLQYSPLSGGDYTEGVVGYPKTINPLYAVNRDIDSDLSYLIYSRLFKYDPQGNLVNDLADDLIISADGKEYLVTIKNNVKWHNGEKLTVDDVLFTIGLIKDQAYRSPLRSGLSAVGIEKINEQTIKFTLSESYAPFQELLTFGILPKSIWEGVSPASAGLTDLNLKPIGSGPYKFKSLIKNKDGDLKEYHLILNEDYYGQKPYLKNINFKFFVDYSEMVKAFNDNQLDGLSYLPFAERAELLSQNSVWFHELVQPQIVSLFFNANKDKAFASKDVRVAIAQAINKEQIIKDVFSGVYQRADGPIMTESFAYNEQLKKYDYSPAEAAIVLKNKLATTTLTVIDSGQNNAVAEKIKWYLEQVGVTVDLKVVATEQASSVVKNRNFEMLLYGESIGGDPDVYVFWHSSQIGSKGLNLAGYSNPETDKLLIDARLAINPDERKTKYQKFQELLTADAPVVFLYSPTYTYVQNKNIKGFVGTVVVNPADRFSSLADWYIKTHKKLTW
ncbi:MAG: ABC transporter substrate-binding protein [Patescibacteria group bacterium]